jgi:hypothetical protein
MRRKLYSLSLLFVALIAGAWSAMPVPGSATTGQPRQDESIPCGKIASQLTGRSAELPIQNRIHDLCEYGIHMDQIPKNVSELDKEFIEDSITGNTLELQTLKIALNGTTNEEWRGVIQMMILQHTADLQRAMTIARKIGADTTPDLTHASVYPGTPDYDLGKRYENLVEEYLNPLMAAAPGGTTGTPTEPPTGMPTDMGTALPKDTATATEVPMDTATPMATDTGTVLPTDTGTAIATDTGTALPADTGTAMATDTMMVMPADTGTPFPTETGTAMATDIGTATAVPTTGPASGSAFDVLSLHIIEEEHTADIQTELAAERLTQNEEIRAFAKHSADVTGLHLLFMGDLTHRMLDNYTPPTPDLQAEYQSPRKFKP